MKINRGRTAIARKAQSKPYRYIMNNNLVTKDMEVLDYGCGRGFDFEYMNAQGYKFTGFDPFQPDYSNTAVLKGSYEVVICNYVFNVIEAPEERERLLEALKGIAKTVIISVRADIKSVGQNWTRYNDGWLTTANTFQKFYSLEDVESSFKTGEDWELTILTSNTNEIMIKLEEVK